MGVVRKISIALTEELAADVEKAVESGDYASNSEVIRDALRHWKDIRDAREAKLTELRRLIQEGLDSGEPIEGNFDVDEAVRLGRQRLDAMRSEP